MATEEEFKAEITTLSARITALEAERDEALGEQFTTNAEGDSITWEEAFEMERSYRGHFEKRATAAEAEVKRLREALELAKSYLVEPVDSRSNRSIIRKINAALAEDGEAK